MEKGNPPYNGPTFLEISGTMAETSRAFDLYLLTQNTRKTTLPGAD